MKQPIRPATLKALRERRGLSQAKLEARSDEMRQKVGIATIKRIETWTETEMYMASQTVAERLAKVLGVTVEDLPENPLLTVRTPHESLESLACGNCVQL